VRKRRTLLALSLFLIPGGCVGSLLGGGKPDTLYRLDLPVQPDMVPSSPLTNVVLLPVSFTPQSSGDRMLTTRGSQASYVKGARWVTAVPELFTQALDLNFRQRSRAVMLTSPRQPAGAPFALQITIDRYEADYHPGDATGDAPTIRVEGQARLYRLPGRTVVATLPISNDRQAARNRIDDIVAAFGGATSAVAASIIDWTDRTAAIAATGER
jgi:cholesterol transport system auxiliary component